MTDIETIQGRSEGWQFRHVLRSRLAALGGFLAVLAGLLALPLLAAEAVAAWRQVPFETTQTYTVEFAAMPEAYRGRARFALRGDGIRPWRMDCARMVWVTASADAALHHCTLASTVPYDFAGGATVPFPTEAGWQVRRQRITLDYFAPRSQAPELWFETLFVLLAAALYWRSRRVAVGGGRHAFLAAAGWCVLVLLADYMVAMATTPWAGAADWQLAALFQTEMAMNPATTILGLVLLGPALEELAFRGIGWRVLERAFPRWGVVALTTAAFVAVHPGTSWALMPQIVAAGLGLALVRIKTGSVVWCFVTHALMNALALW